MQLAQLQDSSTLLTYSLMTTPAPVQVSPSATDPSLAMLTFVVSCPRSAGAANVAQIIISLPVDEQNKPPDPTNLAATAPALSSASISSTGKDQWEVKAGVAPGVFIFSPTGGGPVEVSSQSLTIAFTGIHVNMVVGTAQVRINEWAAQGAGTPPPITGAPSGSATVLVPKFPYGFFAGNLGSDKPMIENGQHPTLTWVGSTNATYKMLWSSGTQDVSTIRTWSGSSSPPSPALTDTTTFILEVSAQGGGQTVTLYFSLTVIVANPSFTAHDLTVLTTSTLDGAVTVGKVGALANIELNGDLNAKGNVNGTDVTGSGKVTGTTVSATNVTASGTVSGNTLNATGNITAGGTGTIPNLNVPGTIQAGAVRAGSMNSTGQMSGSFIKVDGGNNGAGVFSSNSSAPVLSSQNAYSEIGIVTGINSIVASPSDIGVSTNGWVINHAGVSLVTHLPTRNGHRVVTSPLSVDAEVQASGTAKLTQGKSTVQFEADVADIILHTAEHSYRVLLTANGQCNGLAVVNKSGDGFIVEELGNGESDAGFDWFIIARKPEQLGAATAFRLPEKMPKMPELKPPDPPDEE